MLPVASTILRWDDTRKRTQVLKYQTTDRSTTKLQNKEMREWREEVESKNRAAAYVMKEVAWGTPRKSLHTGREKRRDGDDVIRCDPRCKSKSMASRTIRRECGHALGIRRYMSE